jgi:hypothetical protein
MYYKVLDKSLKSHDYQYIIGLNDINIPFQFLGSCVPGGLYFTTVEYIDQFLSFGDYIFQVNLPEVDSRGNPVQSVKDPSGNKYRASCLEITNTFYKVSDFISKYNLLHEYCTFFWFPNKDLEINAFILKHISDSINEDFVLKWATEYNHRDIIEYIYENTTKWRLSNLTI